MVLTCLKAATNFQLRCKIAIIRGYRPKQSIITSISNSNKSKPMVRLHKLASKIYFATSPSAQNHSSWMARNYDGVKYSLTNLAEIMSMYENVKENMSFQLNQWIVAELSSDMTCTGGFIVASFRNLAVGFD